MTEEVRRRCLEPFFTTKGDRGSGLGLAMVYGIVERHDGTVMVESAPGRGARFVFTFPGDTSGVSTETPGPVSSTRPLRILVVDDQPVQCELISHALQRDWHTVDVASNGREALELLDHREYDLVITDKVMPEMNGDQLAALAVKSREPGPRVVDAHRLRQRAGCGALGICRRHRSQKPASLAELRAAISKVMAYETSECSSAGIKPQRRKKRERAAEEEGPLVSCFNAHSRRGPSI